MRINFTPINGGIDPDIVSPTINNSTLLFNAVGIDNDECAIQTNPYVLSSLDKITDAVTDISTKQECLTNLWPVSSKDVLNDEFETPLVYLVNLIESQVSNADVAIISKPETLNKLILSTYGLKYNEPGETILSLCNFSDSLSFDISVSGALHFYTEEPLEFNVFESDSKTITGLTISTNDRVHDEPDIVYPSGAFSQETEPSISRYLEKTSFIEVLTKLIASTNDVLHDEPEINISYTDLRIPIPDPVMQLKNRLSKNPALFFDAYALFEANEIIKDNQIDQEAIQLDASTTLTDLVDGTRYVNLKIKHSAFAGTFILMNESMDTVIYSGTMPVGAFEFDVCTNEKKFNLIAMHPDPTKKLVAIRKIDASSVR